jgi:thiol-disulfide isomerase/thioredoxin
MPALDHLQKTLGGDQFEVLALNMDTRNPEKVPQWLKENGIAALALYTDAEGKAFQTLRKESLVTGLPTTFLVDAKGCVLGGMAGPAEWDSADALALLTSVIEAGRSK